MMGAIMPSHAEVSSGKLGRRDEGDRAQAHRIHGPGFGEAEGVVMRECVLKHAESMGIGKPGAL
ncbi:hypothetical protein Aple_099170 [Acrocarpospora pleiomorpha]|uniref:Uncharacterized protein n=1 Tax=Acrocarpospora pleiomorpha TaxID=90975 RepID=A0A5M3Y6C4_9ACTN|nr:hypothetical protein Aple_099170 [Acrocarpospora pleiomorpha]